MTAMSPAVKDRQKKARARANRIRDGIRSYIHTLGDIAAAWSEGDWKTLGYATWDAYVAEEFSADRVRLPVEQRQKAVDELRLSGMSNRAIASALNVDEATVRRDGAANAAVIEGEIVDPPARSSLVEAIRGEIEDAEARATDHRDGVPGDADGSAPSEGAAVGGPAPDPGEVGRSSQDEVPTSPTTDSGVAAPVEEADASGASSRVSSDAAAGEQSPPAAAPDSPGGFPPFTPGDAAGAGTPAASADLSTASAGSAVPAAGPAPDHPGTSPRPGEAAEADAPPASAAPCEKCGNEIDPVQAGNGFMRCEPCDSEGEHVADDDGRCRLCGALDDVPEAYLPLEIAEGTHGLYLKCGHCASLVAHLKAGMPLALALVEANLHHCIPERA